MWEEYRYDPLGRRVLVRSNRDDLCSGGGSGACVSHVTRFVWSGDQLLWELRLDSEDRANLETPSSTGLYHGRVSYFHAGGIDRPLVIRKEGQPAIIPHENWRGQFSRGTYTSGAVSDCGPGQTTGCTQVNWPGHRTNAWHARSGSGPDIRTWFGGLVDGMRDANGQMYMRNRYYDPASGQFTQTDPIGLAGGLNAYGFAAGDPVSYADPYGTCAWGMGRDAALGNCSASDQRHAPQGEIPKSLSPQQKQQVEAALANLSGTAHTRLSRMLRRGQIMTLSRTALGRAADVDITPSAFGARYRIMLQRDNQEEAAFFTYGTYDASWIIAHEYGHVEQWRNNALIHVQGVTGNIRSFFFEGLNSSNYSILQRDANLFACASVVSTPPVFHSICANGGHSPP